MSSGPRGALRRTLQFFIVVIGVVAGVAQLAGFAAGLARSLLLAVFLACLLYSVLTFWYAYYVQKVRQLREQLALEADKTKLEQLGHQRYLDAIERISAREKPLYSETLEVTVFVGEDGDGDRVVEKRVTTPDPLVTHRMIRPIVPTFSERIVRLADIEFTAHWAHGRITPLALREQINKLQVWLVFDPAMTSSTEWSVEYRPKGLWEPLRDTGWDQLAWDDRLSGANGKPSVFTDFTVRFRFPGGDQPPSVKEQRGYGESAAPVRDSAGTWEVVWRDAKPAGRRYVWDLTRHLP